MHKTQKALLALIGEKNIYGMTLRSIAPLLGENIYPQQVKHHLSQLEKKGLIRIDKIRGIIERVKSGMMQNTNLVSVPILGMANCGPATSIAQERVEGYLQISPSLLLKNKKEIFALRASGSSMNRAKIGGKNIEDGDYVIIDGSDRSAENNNYVLSIIEGMANIKKFIWDKENNQVVLFSESTKDFPPIYINPTDDYSYMINGKVIQIIKKPQVNK
jgi:repressor LexA